MKLILIRHGTAMLESENPEKPLSERGRTEVEKVAGSLKQARIKVDRVWHSPKKRAIETAEIIAQAVGAEDVLETVEGTGPNDSINDLVGKIKKFASANAESSLMIVGHLPFLGKLAAFLLTGSESSDLIAFPSAGVACLDQAGDRWWQLEWIVIPELVPQPRPAQ